VRRTHYQVVTICSPTFQGDGIMTPESSPQYDVLLFPRMQPITPTFMRLVYRALFFNLPLAITGLLLLFSASGIQAQDQLPSPASHINDFAGVVDAQTKTRLETILVNLADKTKVDFYIAIVTDTEGSDIFDFSRKLSSNWNIGSRNSTNKSLLLVVSVGSKTSFTQFSKLAQADLPDGILGEMTQRLRAPLSAGRFAEAVDQAVQLFTSSLAQKKGFAVQDLEPTQTTAEVSQQANDAPRTRPRVVKEPEKPAEIDTATQPAVAEATPTPTPVESPTPSASPEVKPTATEVSQTTTTAEPQPTPEETKRPEVKNPEKTVAKNRSPRTPPKTTKTTNAKKPEEQQAPVEVEDEEETVELTLTLPLTKRAEALKTFLDTHPDSKFRGRATELLISTHAGLGDQFLKAGKADDGIRQLMMAIDQADVSISDQLFLGVISQIPSNLYLRGQADAAFKAAGAIETKFGADPKRLLTIASFYIGLEKGDEAARIAEQAVKIAPELAEAHRVLALSRHINLQLEDAASEYKKTIEIDPTAKASRSSLADLMRASGKPEEALTLYQDLLKTDPKDRSAEAGMVISLFELGRKDEANAALGTALTNDPRNLALLGGMAYWFAAHNEYEKAFDYARRAISVEPRYTWSQIAVVRALIGLKRPVGAERAMRFARQYGKFPTLNYELANVVAAMGLYDEAAEILRESFAIKDGQIETYLAGRILAHDASFIDLLAPERKASIYQPTPADSPASSKMLRDLLVLDSSLTPASADDKLDETAAAKAANDFSGGEDSMKTYRQLYAASQLLRRTVALPTALALVEAAKKGLDDALNVSVVTTAVQAEALRDLRANALAVGNVPEVEEAPRSALNNLMRGRMEDLTGWILFNQDKYPDAIDHLKRAASILPYGTPAWRNTAWHLGVAYEQTGSNNEALDSYINSYNSGLREPSRRLIIEKLYRKINGSLDGLDDKIGPSPLTGATTPEAQPAPSTTATTPVTTDATAADKPAEAPAKPETTTSPQTPQSEPLSDEALKAASARLRSNIKITGRILDSSKNGISNAVVILVSPAGSVISATTDNDGRYSFTVAPNSKTYRVIPSKDGYTFSPVDRTLAGLLDDQTQIDFVATQP
jgi:tetratricopeptide (TPR) repeat protein